ncbi:MAG: AI-2E family transporter [Desulfococcaceae bacterium]
MDTHHSSDSSKEAFHLGPFTSRIIIGLTIALIFALVVFLVFRAVNLLLLLFASYLLAIFLRWGANQVHRLVRLPLPVSLILFIAIFFLLISLFFFFLAPVVQQQAMNLAEDVPQYIFKLKQFLLKKSWGEKVLETTRDPSGLLPEGEGAMSEFFLGIVGVFSTTFGALISVLFILVIGIYLAFQPSVYMAGILRMIPPSRRRRAREIIHRMAETTRGWLLGQSFSMTVLGVVVGTGLWILGIPNAVVLGLLAAIMTFIPNLGPVLAFIPAIFVALSQSFMDAVYVALFYVAVQTIEGNFLTPMVQQRVLSVPAALILATQVLLFNLMGFLGIVLAMPLLACVMVLVQMVYVEDFLGDRMENPVRISPELEEETAE